MIKKRLNYGLVFIITLSFLNGLPISAQVDYEKVGVKNEQIHKLKTYSNDKYHFSLQYPSDWILLLPEDFEGIAKKAGILLDQNCIVALIDNNFTGSNVSIKVYPAKLNYSDTDIKKDFVNAIQYLDTRFAKEFGIKDFKKVTSSLTTICGTQSMIYEFKSLQNETIMHQRSVIINNKKNEYHIIFTSDDSAFIKADLECFKPVLNNLKIW